MTLRAAEAHYEERARLAALTTRRTAQLWDKVDPNNLDTWHRLIPEAAATVTAAQYRAAASADDYIASALDEQGLDIDTVGSVNPDAFIGTAGDGRSLTSLLDQPRIATLLAIADGLDIASAMTRGRSHVQTIAATQVQDIGRSADSVAMFARPRVGYVRMVNAPCCSRCAILAGKFFRSNQGFQRHPRCFPAGVTVSGPAVDAATRRRYQGELVIIRTASGQELPATGNHPVLTDRGWVPANLLHEGDHVIRSLSGEGAVPLVVPHEQQMPSRIEDLWRPDRMVTLRQVPTTAEDFHGDGGHGEVDVVLADRLLWDGLQSPLPQFTEEEQLAGRVAQSERLAGFGSTDQEIERLLDASRGFMCGAGLGSTLVGRHATGSDFASIGPASDIDPDIFESLAERRSRDAVADAERVLALAGQVRRRDVTVGQGEVAARWDAPAGPFTVESRGGYASRGEDLRLRLSGQVASDRIIELRRIEWSGHVYNLTSVEGWYSANGLIVSNCDCLHIPTTEDFGGDIGTNPHALVASGKVNGLNTAEREALAEGADLNQVVNARRGRSGMTTSEGTTRRGTAGKRLQGRQRLTPDAIHAQAATRDEAVELLRAHGYLI